MTAQLSEAPYGAIIIRPVSDVDHAIELSIVSREVSVQFLACRSRYA